MPEGDTVHKLAVALDEALRGVRLERLELRGGQRIFPRAAVAVVAVSALGKHCLIDLSNGYSLRIHLGMHGTWNRHKGAWRRHREVQLVLQARGETFVCVQPKDVELMKTADKKRHPALTSLGPDLLGAEPDWEDVFARVARLCPPDRTLGEVLLDQRVAAGLGNVYKNELCFLGPLEGGPAWRPTRGTSPFTSIESLSRDELLDVFRRGRELLLLNLGGWSRTTAFDPRGVSVDAPHGRVFVYGRQGKPCVRCRTAIVSRAQGLEARPTHWCPSCQPLNAWGPTYFPPEVPARQDE
jgi:endonuclease VIII